MSNTTRSFALAAAIAILFNTVLACAKDAYGPLNHFMNSLLGHNWTTQGAADLLVFFILGFILTKTSLSRKMTPLILALSVTIAVLSLFLWYIFF